ncbi:Hint domain-containing protein [Celeribacter sp.]|uniref:Hint domain-containing protein n=1 Tax=Celeribacter sp. TaxID=1890673 RepID=UPI003A956108
MTTVSLILQNVNGDPSVSGGNINITTGTTIGAVFNEPSGSVSLSTVLLNDSVTIGGFTYSYDYLGAGDVRGDESQPAAFIRVTSSPSGSPLTVGQTFAIDLSGQPGDPDYPNLQKGNTKLQVSDLDESEHVQFPGVPCFVAGTPITTRFGAKSVEAIEVGDEVWTLDHGLQTVRWIGCVEADAVGHLAPIEFTPGTIGNHNYLKVSPQHRVLIRGWGAELVCGTDQVLVPACHLLSEGKVRRVVGGRVCYVHLLFDHHEIVETDGALSESLYIGTQSLKTLPNTSVAEIFELFPELKMSVDQEPMARKVARRHEAALLAPAQPSAERHSAVDQFGPVTLENYPSRAIPTRRRSALRFCKVRSRRTDDTRSTTTAATSTLPRTMS